ncbi:MAG TPA: hypothetical protein VLM76_09880 [Patescibacteria group bacterium]|nr:hypothetical protein [Patescibacteria group bacterium]
MVLPTLTLGATVLTLPYPSRSSAPSRELDTRMVQRRTIGGRLRTTVLSHGFVYRLTFTSADSAAYDAIGNLWLAAVATGAYPLFTWPDMFPTAVGVRVSVALSPAVAAPPGDEPIVNFTLTLEEADPR